MHTTPNCLKLLEKQTGTHDNPRAFMNFSAERNIMAIDVHAKGGEISKSDEDVSAATGSPDSGSLE